MSQNSLAKALVDRMNISQKAKARLLKLHEVISNIERRNATREAQQLQPPTQLSRSEILTLAYGAFALFLSGFLN